MKELIYTEKNGKPPAGEAEYVGEDLEGKTAWLVPHASTAESSSPTTPDSPTLAPEAWKILSDRVSSIEDQLHVQYLTLKAIQKSLETLTAALAEDKDPDDMPATYMDGSPV